MECITCGRAFESKRNPNQKACSRSCNAKARAKEQADRFKVPKCSICGKETRRQSKAKFCSRKCYAESCVREGNANWKQGVTLHSDGYRYVRVGRKYVLEHRHLMELKLGRKLTAKEVVHHENGKKDDNRLSNLELLNSQADHLKEHGYLLKYR